ncbi:MAG: hypothetical protein GXP29_13915, partial [Planctomycetes bacterium]|nr:hypothetical protein [Planctomycetota bacterium]
ETAAWLDDYFWMDLIQRWSDAPISIHLQPTPQVMQHEIINHQLNMLRRVVPHWRLIGQCYISDLEVQSVLQQTAVAVYHEVHILDGRRTDAPTSKPSLDVEEAIAGMRDIQRANKRSTPIFVGVQVREERSSAEQSVHAKHTISAGAVPSVANSMA